MLIFIAFQLGIDNDNLAHNVAHTVIGDTMLLCKHVLVKGKFGKLRFGAVNLRLYSVNKNLHCFQIIVRSDTLCRPRR